MTTESILTEVKAERELQDKRWGEQNHPDGTGTPLQAFKAKEARVLCDVAFENGRCTWQHILEEEVAEAFAESDHVRLREELVQVAAVVVNWIEAIDRRSDTSGIKAGNDQSIGQNEGGK